VARTRDDAPKGGARTSHRRVRGGVEDRP
jgi:hypothetical protein